jgi:hypothetical protein
MDFQTLPSSVDPDRPLIYMWEVLDEAGTVLYRYIGKAKDGAERPLTHYSRNVDNLLAGRPYRAGKADGYRQIHRELARAVAAKHRICLTLLQNVATGENINEIERTLQIEHGCRTSRRPYHPAPTVSPPVGAPRAEQGPTVTPGERNMSRTEKRGIVWTEMGRLQELRLGRRVIVSDQRDKFVLEATHPAAARLTTQPNADGFIRSDRGGLLFRNASASLRGSVPSSMRADAMASSKGLEFRWTALDNASIRTLFDVVRKLAVGSDVAPSS